MWRTFWSIWSVWSFWPVWLNETNQKTPCQSRLAILQEHRVGAIYGVGTKQRHKGDQTDRLFFGAVPHAGAVKQGKFNFIGGEFSREVRT